jgi:hypothetical protein
VKVVIAWAVAIVFVRVVVAEVSMITAEFAQVIMVEASTLSVI